jgi:H/ACA ribonucleoprotein complex subunit 1
MLVKNINKNYVPKFNRPLYTESRQTIGKVDEILGPINSYLFSINMEEGVKAENFSGKG